VSTSIKILSEASALDGEIRILKQGNKGYTETAKGTGAGN